MRRSLVAAVALLFPRVAADVIAEGLPESGCLFLGEVQPTDPLRALPEVEVRHHEPSRAAVLGIEWRPVVLVRDEGLAVDEVRQTEVRCISAVGDRKSTRLNSSHLVISYAVFC